ncbi:MAG TPA: outer membrane protein transport protein [Mesorhizobium sp.]|jgi:long-chain fatty acid transport protein
MGNSRVKALLGTAFLSLAMGGAAYAGGFSRGSADTDLIYEDGNFNMRSSVTYVSPHREFSKNPNPALVGTSYTEDYMVPSAAAKFNLTDNLRCVGTYVQNNGGSARYDFPTYSGKTMEEFTTYEAAGTCGVSFDAGQGKFWLLGGGYIETLDYYRENSYGPFGNAQLSLDGRKFGYRIGAAYEIPELALRGQVMYRSGTDYGAQGTATAPAGVLAGALARQGVPNGANPFLALPATAAVPVAATGVGNLPQSVDIKFQTGIAPGWLAFGAVKWTDWSTLSTLDVRSVKGGFLLSSDQYHWKDGWTVTGGVGHKFNDAVSGLVSLTWDQGVATGWDLQSDSYTLASGVALKDKLGGELRGGVGFTYIDSATETKNFDPITGADQNQAVKAGYAVALNLGYNIKW